MTADAAVAADLDPNLPRQSLDLKGKQEVTEVVTLRVGAGVETAA